MILLPNWKLSRRPYRSVPHSQIQLTANVQQPRLMESFGVYAQSRGHMDGLPEMKGNKGDCLC